MDRLESAAEARKEGILVGMAGIAAAEEAEAEAMSSITNFGWGPILNRIEEKKKLL